MAKWNIKDIKYSPLSEEEANELLMTFDAFFEYNDKKQEFLDNGGTIFPEGNPRPFNKLNRYEKDEVLGYLDMATAPTTGIFEGETAEEKYGVDLLNEVSYDLSK